MIQVDIDEEVLGVNRPADLAILADVSCFSTGSSKTQRQGIRAYPLEPRRQKVAKSRKGAGQGPGQAG